MTRLTLRLLGVLTAAGAFLALAAGVLAAPPAEAHGVASSLVRVSLAEPSTGTTGAELRIVAKVPLQELDAAYGTTLMDEAADTSPTAVVAVHADELEQMFLDKVALDTDGAAWKLAVDSLASGINQGQDAVRIVLRATGAPPSAGIDTSEVDLTWGVITDVVVTHDVYVGGVADDGTTTLVATLTRDHPTATLTVDDPGRAVDGDQQTLWSVGWHHFREGADHLLFLSLVALAAVRRRTGWTSTARRLALLTLTFTAGHSLSLALATLGWVTLPSQWVEVAIAATILLAAAHVVRPRLTTRAEVAVTGLFGLVHGFGFAGTLESLSLHGRDLVLPLLTFNLGLEAAQLAALVLVVAPVLVIARSTTASRVLAGVIGAVAVGWILQRAWGAADPLDPLVSVALASPERLALLLGIIAVALLVRRSPRAVAASPVDGAQVERELRPLGSSRTAAHTGQSGTQRLRSAKVPTISEVASTWPTRALRTCDAVGGRSKRRSASEA